MMLRKAGRVKQFIIEKAVSNFNEKEEFIFFD
jgi:hypothetical protein